MTQNKLRFPARGFGSGEGGGGLLFSHTHPCLGSPSGVGGGRLGRRQVSLMKVFLESH